MLVLTDDQWFRSLTPELMPNVHEELVDQGVNFTRAYVNLALCCPSRASILTGLYAHHTGVDRNDTPLHRDEIARPTFVQALHQAGYRTMVAGKYLNSETCQPRPGWDRWVCGNGTDLGGFHPRNPNLNIDGRVVEPQGYTVDILAGEVVDFIESNEDPDQPFFVLYTPKSPHLPATDPRYASMPVAPYNPPSLNQVPDPASRPNWQRVPPLPGPDLALHRERLESMTRQIPPLDDAIGQILDALGDRAEDTMVIFTSDNGYMFGEHRLFAKHYPFEESSRVPLVIRYPALLPPEEHFVSDAPVSNVDLAPTIMELAGVPWAADGKSLVPILSKEASSVQEGVLLEWCQVGGPDCLFRQPGHLTSYYGVATERYKYLDYVRGEKELYDLQRDPYELVNLAGNPEYAALERLLSARLGELRVAPEVPDTTIASATTSADGHQVSFEFFSQALETALSCRLQGPGQRGAWQPCPNGRATYSDLEEGEYVFAVQSRDVEGDVDPSPATRSFNVG